MEKPPFVDKLEDTEGVYAATDVVGLRRPLSPTSDFVLHSGRQQSSVLSPEAAAVLFGARDRYGGRPHGPKRPFSKSRSPRTDT